MHEHENSSTSSRTRSHRAVPPFPRTVCRRLSRRDRRFLIRFCCLVHPETFAYVGLSSGRRRSLSARRHESDDGLRPSVQVSAADYLRSREV
jgi:hypothetical protein